MSARIAARSGSRWSPCSGAAPPSRRSRRPRRVMVMRSSARARTTRWPTRERTAPTRISTKGLGLQIRRIPSRSSSRTASACFTSKSTTRMVFRCCVTAFAPLDSGRSSTICSLCARFSPRTRTMSSPSFSSGATASSRPTRSAPHSAPRDSTRSRAFKRLGARGRRSAS